MMDLFFILCNMLAVTTIELVGSTCDLRTSFHFPLEYYQQSCLFMLLSVRKVAKTGVLGNNDCQKGPVILKSTWS